MDCDIIVNLLCFLSDDPCLKQPTAMGENPAAEVSIPGNDVTNHSCEAQPKPQFISTGLSELYF